MTSLPPSSLNYSSNLKIKSMDSSNASDLYLGETRCEYQLETHYPEFLYELLQFLQEYSAKVIEISPLLLHFTSPTVIQPYTTQSHQLIQHIKITAIHFRKHFFSYTFFVKDSLFFTRCIFILLMGQCFVDLIKFKETYIISCCCHVYPILDKNQFRRHLLSHSIVKPEH